MTILSLSLPLTILMFWCGLAGDLGASQTDADPVAKSTQPAKQVTRQVPDSAQPLKSAGADATPAAGTPAKGSKDPEIATPKTTAATRQASDAAPAGDAPAKTINEKKLALDGWQVLILAIVLVGFLGFMFWLLFHLMHKWDQSSYLGELYKDTINDIEYKRLRSAITGHDYYQDILDDAEWMKQNPPPLHISIFRGRGTGPGAVSTGTGWGTGPGGPPGGGSADDEKSWKDYYAKIEKERIESDAWNRKVDMEILRRQTIDVVKARKTAKERTTNALNIDWNILRGRGPEFILEFSAVLVIIFAALISVTLGVLDSQQIGTLLAAIAGYVLGRSANRAQPNKNEPVPDKREPATDTSATAAPAATVKSRKGA